MAAFQLNRSTDELAREIIRPFVSKLLSKTSAAKLVSLIEKLIRYRTAAMLTYSREEVERIARYQSLSPEKVNAVLTHGGGHCTDDEGVALAWSRDIDEGRDLLDNDARSRIEAEIELLLHASRDGMRNKGIDTTVVPFDMRNDAGYYCEAFGALRALALLGYGYLSGGRSDDPMNLKVWFTKIEQRVLAEEGYFDATHRCAVCRSRYGKDTVIAK